jgi:hypothetical protein
LEAKLSEIDVRVSPALHPLNVREVDGYCEETAPILAPTESAFRTAYDAVRACHDARAFGENNPAWTEGAVIIQTDALARKHMDRVTRGFDSARARLKDGIASIERELSAPVVSKATANIAAEVRSHMKGLPFDQRMSLLRQVIQNGDDISATAVLGGPAFLSGLNDEMQALLTRTYHERNSPGAVLRLRAMKGAVELIERNGPVVFAEFAKAVGCPPAKVKALREANTAAERAMVFQDPA